MVSANLNSTTQNYPKMIYRNNLSIQTSPSTIHHIRSPILAQEMARNFFSQQNRILDSNLNPYVNFQFSGMIESILEWTLLFTIFFCPGLIYVFMYLKNKIYLGISIRDLSEIFLLFENVSNVR
jgi:hypothetical protein